MKNLFILTVFALIALTSCKKDYTCECKSYYSVMGIVDPYETEFVSSSTIKDTKSNAKEACDKKDFVIDEYELGLGVIEKNYVDCEIK